MSRPPRGLRPTAEHELLLKAALLDGDEAQRAFDAWIARYDLDGLHGPSIRLLPLIHHNLRPRLDGGSPIARRIQGVCRQAWYKNQLFLDAAGAALDRFERAGIPTVVLNDLPLALAYYPPPATRPLLRAQILIPPERAADALAAALDAGLTPRFPAEDWPPRSAVFRAFTHPAGWHFDLHVNVLHERWPGADRDFWAASVPITVGGAPTRTLVAEDLLLHVLALAVRTRLPAAAWMADLTMLARARGGSIDWERLLHQAGARRLLLTVRDALRGVEALELVRIPSLVRARLDDVRIHPAEWLEHRARLAGGPLGTAAGKLADYGRARGRQPEWRGPLGLLRYVRDELRASRAVQREREADARQPAALAERQAPPTPTMFSDEGDEE